MNLICYNESRNIYGDEYCTCVIAVIACGDHVLYIYVRIDSDQILPMRIISNLYTTLASQLHI